MQTRRTVSLLLGAIAGNVIAERFVLQAPGSDTGFIPVTDGIGLDELVRAGVIVLSAYGVDRLLGKVWQ